jgi:hypothetical protein
MATLTNTKIKNTYKSLLKVSDNGNLEAGLQEITDGEGNASGVQLNTSGDLTASGTVAFGSLKDSGENITITKLVDEADGISSNDNDTTIPTSAAVKDYVDTKVTAEDLDFAGDSGTGAVDLDSQILTIEGTANEVVTSASGQTLTIGLPSTINVDVQGALTGNVTGNVSGNVTGNVTGNVSGDLTGNVTATSVLANGVVATTQASSDNSTKVATTAFVKSVVTAEDLDFGGDSGTGSVDLDSQTLTIAGTANEIVTSAAGQTLTVGLPSSITVDVVGNLTGNVSGNVTGDVTGNADTATALETSRTIALSGDVVASGSFDGSANLTLSATIQPNSVALGTDTTGDYVSNLGAGTGVTIASNTGEGSNPTITVNYGSTANTSVEGDTALTIQGTVNEIEVSGGAVTLGSGGTVTVGLPDNVIIAGDLTVNGTTTTVNTQTLSVKDPLIELANQNLSNSVDTGFFADYSLDAGVTTKYAGLFKDSSDSDKFKLFKGLEVEPATTVDVAGTGYTKGDLVVNDLDAVTISGTLSTAAQTNITSVGTLSSLAVSGNLTVDTNTLFVDAANNWVGIGTSSPSRPIHILAPTPGIKLEDTTGNDFGEIVSVDGDLYIRADEGATQASSSIRFQIDQSEKVRIDSSGNVGIGTAPDADAELHIYKNGDAARVRIEREFNPQLDLESLSGYARIGTLNNFPLAFQTNAAERMRITSSGNVGIGTSNADYLLTAFGNAQRIGLKVPSAGEDWSDTDLGGFVFRTHFGTQEKTGMYAVGNFATDTYQPNLVFRTNAADRLVIKSSGNVGIGTSSPASLLHIYNSSSAEIKLETTAGSALLRAISDTLVYRGDSHIFQSEGGTERLRIDSSGNLGIGISSPATKVDIAKDDIVDGVTLRLTNTHNGSDWGLGSKLGVIDFYSSDSSSAGVKGSIELEQSSAGTTSPSETDFVFNNFFGGSLSEKMRIDASGNVGIGESTPLRKLHITDSSSSTYIRIETGNTNISGIEFADTDDTNVGRISYDHSDNSMEFRVNDAERMRIDSSGQVGIGTGSPNATLEVMKGSEGLYLKVGGDNATNNRALEFTSSTSSGASNGALHTINAGSSNGEIALAINGVEKARITANGLTFNGDTAAANALDDYEEGSFTPEVADATTGGNTATGTFNGYYTKIGNKVTVQISLSNIDTTGMTGANDLFITNLPFTADLLSGLNLFQGAALLSYITEDANTYNITSSVTDNTSYLRFAQSISGSLNDYLEVSQLQSGSSDIWTTVTYLV